MKGGNDDELVVVELIPISDITDHVSYIYIAGLLLLLLLPIILRKVNIDKIISIFI